LRSIDSAIVEPVGDVSGTVSHAMTATTLATATIDSRIVVFIAARTQRRKSPLGREKENL
jgi:hypothetical protein